MDSGQIEITIPSALAAAISADEAAIFEPESEGFRSALVCRSATGCAPNDAAVRRYLSGEGLCGAAALTGEPASHFEPAQKGRNPASSKDVAQTADAEGLLRLAVPIMRNGRCVCVIEIMKRQPEPHAASADLFIIRTFGTLYAMREMPPGTSMPQYAHTASPTVSGVGAQQALGRSSAFARANRLVVKAAASDTPVIILGETGTGKELVARQLHDASRRRGKPYIAINCASLSDSVLESELFGHVKGAFTGAHQKRRGKLEEADGGTVFLDEVAEMSPVCQAKLLRTLEAGEITPLGSNKVSRINVRFIAATNQDLESLIQTGKFRSDLYYRLQGMQIELPPLRKRRGDTELLAIYFLQREAEEQGAEIKGFSPAALELLKSYPWPGNIRELKRAVNRAVTMAEGEWIEPWDFPDAMQRAAMPTPTAGTTPGAEPTAAPSDERMRITQALAATAYPGTGRWNVRAAARLLGMNHYTLAYKIDKVYRLRDLGEKH